ncbi:MAG: hypothetical protein LBH43_06650 [Treponema sp.]|jgi:hypothetical protein|nr:hypothetical protein [Treponema sp.]
MDERIYVRELAKKLAEIAALPVMEKRLKKWRALNNGEIDTPLVTVEFNGPPEEVFPPLKCESPLARNLEKQISKNIRNHELLDDDRVIPGCVSVNIPNRITPFGINVEHIPAYHSDGQRSMGYALEYIIEDLQADYGKLKKTVIHTDAGLKEAKEEQAKIEEFLGGLLPVKICFPSFYFVLGNVVLNFMGMQNMMITLYDYPELFHQLMNTLTEDYLRYMKEIEDAGAILCNNDGSWLGQGSWGYTDSLPSTDEKSGQAVTFADVWGYTNFQETVGMSPQMFDEFFFSYMEKITRRFGLLSYGCCEPADGLWDRCLSRLANLRKVSVSAWCREEALAEKIRGKKIVYHRKPSANYISVDSVFNESAFGGHIAKSVKAAAGCPLEVTFREELTVHGEPQRLTRAVEITREQFARHYQA